MADEYDVLFDNLGQVRADRVDDLLVEVVSGKYLFTLPNPPQTLYASRCPTMAEQDHGRIIYAKKLREVTGKGLMTRVQLEQHALEHGLFKPNERNEKNALLKMVERQQAAKEKSMDPRQKVQLTTEIDISRRRVLEIDMAEYEVLQHCAEARAEDARISFFISCCTFGGDVLDERVWKSFNDFMECSDWAMLHESRRAYHRVSGGLPVKVIRALARTSEWRVRWKSTKESGASPFDGNSSNWDRNKVNLIYWSDFYDNIYQHPDCPDETTVSNDDHLQEWLNGQLAKRKQQQAQNPTSNRASPTYIDGAGRRRTMTKLGADKTLQVGTPYKVRV